MKDKENRDSVEFDRLHEKDYSDKLIYGRSTLTEFEKAFISDSVDHNFEYIGAPGGEEDNTAKSTYFEFSFPRYRYSIDYPDEGIKCRQVINLNIWEVDAGVYGTIRGVDYPADKKISISQIEENFYKQANVELQKYYVNGVFDAQAAIQGGVPISVVIKHILDNRKEVVKDNNLLTKELDKEFNKQCVKEFKVWGDFMQRVDDKHYSNLSNININKGQGDMFSYTNISPAATSKRDEKVSKTYRPLPDCLTIKESSIDGLGLFATEDIDKDVTLGITHNYIDVGFKDELIRTPLSGFLNHSTNPNATIEEFENGKGISHTYKNYKLVTLRPIRLGEEITVNYNDCLCGLSGYDGAEFLKEDKLEDRVYKNKDGIPYYYNSTYGKFQSTYGSPNNNPIFYTPEDAEKFLKRVIQ